MAKQSLIMNLLILGLFMLYIGLGNLYIYGAVDEYPVFARSMLVTTLIYVIQGPITESLGFYRVSIGVGITAFIALCILLFYSSHWYDLLVFAPCVTVMLLHRSFNMYDDLKDQYKQRKAWKAAHPHRFTSPRSRNN